jgi:hypothetical protein
MTTYPCPCAACDWRDVIQEATRKGEPCPEHHPLCTAKRVAVSIAETVEALDSAHKQLTAFTSIEWETTQGQMQDVLKEILKLNLQAAKKTCKPSAYPPSHCGSVVLRFPVDDAKAAVFMSQDEGEFCLHNDTLKMQCAWTKTREEIAFNEAKFELSFRILDILSPPEARAAWLKEKDK